MAAALPDDFFQLVERASDLILIVRAGRIAYGNPAFATTLGYTRDEIVGMDVLATVHPDEREASMQRILQTVAGAKGTGRRRRLVRKDGSEVAIEASTFPAEFGGAPAAVLIGRDLTEREQAEKERRRGEADFRNLVQSLPGGVLVHRAGNILFVNGNLAGLLGSAPEKMIGGWVLDYIPPSFTEEVRSVMTHNITSNEPLPLRELTVRAIDGSIRVIEISGIPVRFEEQDARFVYINDVTKRHAAERRLRALVQSSPLAISSFDPQARVTSWNPAAESMFGWPPSVTVPDPLILPESTTIPVRLLCAAAEREGIATHEREVMRRSDGKRLWVHTSAAPIRDPEGNVEGFVLTTADVTEAHGAADALRAAAEEWQASFDAVDAPALLLDGPTRDIVRINRAALELAGKAPSNLGAVADREPWTTASRLVESAGKSGATALEQVRAGERTWLLSASPLPQGRLMLVLRDVTRIERLQDSLRHSEAMSAMGELVAGVAHEVRNPLFGMGATLDAMEQAFGSDPRQEPFLRRMRRELDRISVLMRDLLEYGRPPAVQLVMDGLAPVVALAARSCLPAAELASVRIENEVGADAGALPMDAGRLAQVFQNLIENAVQHSPAGGRVHVVATRMPAQTAVSVLDSGSGFNPEDLPRIFDPFFSRRRGGTGLGLSIVQRIVEQHGGRIEARNRPEGGASVSVLLPLPST